MKVDLMFRKVNNITQIAVNILKCNSEMLAVDNRAAIKPRKLS